MNFTSYALLQMFLTFLEVKILLRIPSKPSGFLCRNRHNFKEFTYVLGPLEVRNLCPSGCFLPSPFYIEFEKHLATYLYL